ncbi:MAG: hypothetical protein WDO13_00945 [Verrucomicrobiota bacterium]
MDEGYVSDPSLFYLPLAGKSPPRPGQRLRPENVGWDVTSGVAASSAKGVPVVFLTGYRIHFAPGGSATPLAGLRPYEIQLSLKERWAYRGLSSDIFRVGPGLAVAYNTNDATFLHPPAGTDGVVPNVVPSDFTPDGRIYRQLTPEGVLP